MRAPGHRISKYFSGARGALTGQRSFQRCILPQTASPEPPISPGALPRPPRLSPPPTATPRVAFLAMAEAPTAGEQAQPKFMLLKAALTLPWPSAWKPIGLAQGKALAGGGSSALAAWRGSSPAEGQQKRFTGSRRAGSAPQGCYPSPPQLLPAACVNGWGRQQGSAFGITWPPSNPSQRDQLDRNPFCWQ